MKDAELLTRDQLKNVFGGDNPGGSGCFVSVSCYVTIWQNGAWVTIQNTASCSGSSCSMGDHSVTCDGSEVDVDCQSQ